MSVDSRRIALLFVALSTSAAAQEQVFEPGSKHVCVPAANGEGWDCRSSEATPAAATPADPAKPREPRLRSSSQVPDETPKTESAEAEPATTVEPLAPAAPAPASAPPPAVAAPRASSRNVPNYLLAPEARTSGAAAPTPTPARRNPEPVATAPAAPAPAAAAPRPAAAPPATPEPERAVAPPEPVAATPAPIESASPPPAATPEPPAPEPVAETPAPRVVNPPVTAPAPPAPRETALLGESEFRRLGDSRYVIELASGSSRDAVENEASLYAHDNVYLLTLKRDGEAWYLAVRGDFDSVDAARAARAEALAGGATRVGWPRRVGPLKQELGR